MSLRVRVYRPSIDVALKREPKETQEGEAFR
jgi:hypothetical protein